MHKCACPNACLEGMPTSGKLHAMLTVVEGTNVITGHKCNKGHKCNNIWSQM